MTAITVISPHISEVTIQTDLPTPKKLTDWLHDHHYPLNTRCGQKGLCRGCRVIVQKGHFLHNSAALEADTKPIEVDACLCEILPNENLKISIPERSLLHSTASAVDEFRLMVTAGSESLFSSGEAGDIAAAIDIGTTTVAVVIFNIASGNILARASDFNAQIKLGDDVVTRINLCITNPHAREQLQLAVSSQTVYRLILEACHEAQISPSKLRGISIAGNTTMLHLLAGENPAGLGTYPFHPVFLETRRGTAEEFKIAETESSLPKNLPIVLLPGLAAYVGADISAGIVATGMRYAPQPALLIDIGTNGEMAILHKDKWLSCATAAGPAFEGSGLLHGTRAVKGAISEILICESHNVLEISLKTIGNTPIEQANGICGSAYIDFLAQGRISGLIQENGRFDKLFVQKYSDYFEKLQDGIALRITQTITISEIDVALLLQAKAAIAAGIETMLKRTGISASELSTLFVAGGFGMHINLSHAIKIGLLPLMDEKHIQVVGNSSLAGAYMAALDTSALAEMEALAGKVETIELNLDPDFEDRFISALTLE